MEKTIAQIVADSENATILGTGPNGEKYVSFEDYANLTSMKTLEARGAGKQTATEVPELNPDGTYASSNPRYIAISLDDLYLNRAKVTEDHVYVVKDWWCIKTQDSGRVPVKQVPCFVFKREGKKLTFENATVISDAEFIAEYTEELGHKTMAQIFPYLQARGREKVELI